MTGDLINPFGPIARCFNLTPAAGTSIGRNTTPATGGKRSMLSKATVEFMVDFAWELSVDDLIFDDALAVYLSELKKVPALAREEEMECIQHVRAGDEQAEYAGKRLVEANLQLVVTMVERSAGDKMHILDLIQEGNRGLISAIETLRDSSADNFATLATPLIEHSISTALATTRPKIIPPHLM